MLDPDLPPIPPLSPVSVTRRRAFTLRSAFVVLVLCAVLGVAVDVVYRNETTAELLRRIERAEQVLSGALDSSSSGSSQGQDSFTEALAEVSALEAVSWYRPIVELQIAYVEHGRAWASYLDGADDLETLQGIDRTWSVFCVELASATPYLDYGAVERAAFYIAERGDCPT